MKAGHRSDVCATISGGEGIWICNFFLDTSAIILQVDHNLKKFSHGCLCTGNIRVSIKFSFYHEIIQYVQLVVDSCMKELSMKFRSKLIDVVLSV